MRMGLFIIILTIISCSSTKVINKEDYVLKKYESKKSRYLPYLIVSCFDYNPVGKKSPIPASIRINNLYFSATVEGDSIHDLIFRPLPNNTIGFEASFIGKIPVQINNLRIKESDSIIIEIYMKDTNEILYDY